MYEVVGCSDCRALWIREGDAETAECPRCGRTHDVDKLRALAETDSADAARDARTRLLAERADHGDDVAAFSELKGDVEAAGVPDATYLNAHDLDEEAIDAQATTDGTRDRSPRQLVLAAIDSCETPTRDAILDRVAEHGLARAEADDVLTRLTDTGHAIREGETFRVVE